MPGRKNDISEREMTLAYSPCPNDTFIFFGIASGRLSLSGAKLRIALDDVEALNRAALRERHDITKLSFHTYLLVKDRYKLLNAGAALGYGCGPIVVSSRPMSPEALPAMRVAVPGELTTAHLLLRLFSPKAEDKVFVRYDSIIEMVRSGEADAGVIIHEDRFVYEEAGLSKVVDLGEWWEERTGCPIPLGGIAVRRTLPDETGERVDELIRASIETARRTPEAALPYIRAHAQQMKEEILRRHIAAFVNNSTLDLGEAGRNAIARLEQMARRAGVIP